MWNLGRSTAGIRAQIKTSSTSIIYWPLLATASSSSELLYIVLFLSVLSVSVHLYVHQCEYVYTHTCSILYSLFKTPCLSSQLLSSSPPPLLSSVSPPFLSSPLLRTSTESLQQQLSSRSASRFSRTPPGPLAALDRAVRRACRLVMDQLLLELQPFLQGLLSRSWLAQGDVTVTLKLCGVLERHFELYSRVRPPCRQVRLFDNQMSL